MDLIPDGQSGSSSSLYSNVWNIRLIILLELLQPLLQYSSRFPSYVSAVHGFASTALSYTQTSSSLLSSLYGTFTGNELSGVASLLLLVLILYVSLKITGLLFSWVWSWVWLFVRLALWATAIYFGVQIWQSGVGEVVSDVAAVAGDWVAMVEEWFDGLDISGDDIRRRGHGGQAWR
jgi:hypothetical protein